MTNEELQAIKERERRMFENELEQLINKYSIENESNTPDFILADYLRGCLDLFAKTSKAREKWFGKELRIGGSKQEKGA